MKKIIFAILLMSILFPIVAENKTALLIANGDYSSFSDLNQPIPEARALKSSLERLGFDVSLLTNVSRETMLDGLMSFERRVKSRGGIAFFHYGGHAVQVDGNNYLIPANASIPDERRVSTRAVNSEEVMATLEASGSDTNIIILDSCRNNPLPGGGRRASRGLAVAGRKPPNSIIVYSAESGTTARDGVFTPTLISYLETPGLSFTDILRKTRQKVYEITNGAQIPGSYDQLFQPVYFSGSSGSVTKKPGFQMDAEVYGSIKVSLAEKGTVYVDGIHMGSINAGRSATLSDITTGNHQIDIRYGSHSEQRSIQVNENKTAYASFNYKAPVETPQVNDRMVRVSGGTFQMGSTSGVSNEKPVHSVTLSDFYIGKYEVTQGEYKALMGKSPSHTSFGIGDNYPVNKVSWNDAVEYCNALSRKDGLTPVYSGSGNNIRCNFNVNGYRLPTEAEWEYAARGGRSSRGYTYAGSNNIDAVAWYWKNSGDKTLSGDWNWDAIKANNGKNHPVAQKQANELGLYDMSGNVWEWCWDWSGNYSSGSQSDPVGTSTGTMRVYRGGCWGDDAYGSRSAYRNSTDPSYRDGNLGFRVVRRL